MSTELELTTEISSVIDRIQEEPKPNKINILPTLEEITTPADQQLELAYNSLTTLVNGLVIGPDNWVLLLNKALVVVSTIKELDYDARLDICIGIVSRYLKDHTTLDTVTLKLIDFSIMSMCLTILGNTGIIKPPEKKKVTARLGEDTDLLASPLQIIDITLKKVINTVKTRGLTFNQFIKTVPELAILVITTLDKYKHLTGLEKKTLAVQVFGRLFKEVIINIPGANQALLDTLTASIPFVIDTLNNVTKGKPGYVFDLKDPVATISSSIKLLRAIMPCCFK